jgi:hypothetical protein
MRLSYLFLLFSIIEAKTRIGVIGDLGYLSSEEFPLMYPAVKGLVEHWSAKPVRNLLVELADDGEIDTVQLLGDIGYADNA